MKRTQLKPINITVQGSIEDVTKLLESIESGKLEKVLKDAFGPNISIKSANIISEPEDKK